MALQKSSHEYKEVKAIGNQIVEGSRPFGMTVSIGKAFPHYRAIGIKRCIGEQ